MMSTILIVEDNPLNMELATDLLEAAGYDVRQAFSAEDGLHLAREERPDLILMDLRLPGMDGYAALQALRADPMTVAIPTVALTAEAMMGDDKAAVTAGFDSYLSKPIDTRVFLREIARLLSETVV